MARTFQSPFCPDESHLQHSRERQEWSEKLRKMAFSAAPAPGFSPPRLPKTAAETPASTPRKSALPFSPEAFFERFAPEDSALLLLAVFLLSDNAETDPVLVGLLVYLLLAG